jgi:hypothetical protein
VKKFFKVRVGRRVVLVEQASPLTGWRVTRDGVRWSRLVGEVEQLELIVFGPADVLGELRMNLHYGELEDAR